MTVPEEDRRLDSLKERVESLERALDERAADSVFGRCYGVLAAILIALTLVPYTDSGNDSAWSVPVPRSSETIGTFSVMFVVPLLFLLLWATVRPGRSPALGWVVAGLALAVGVLNWIVIASLRFPSTSAYGLALVSFVIAIFGAGYSLYWLRQTRGQE